MCLSLTHACAYIDAPFASGALGLLNDPVLVDISKAVGKSVGQVILRYDTKYMFH